MEGYDGELVGKVKDGGKEVAVKDMWLDEGSQTEWQNQAEVCERMKKKISKEEYGWAPSPLRSALDRAFQDGYQNYFIKIECDRQLAKPKLRSGLARPTPSILHVTPEETSNQPGQCEGEIEAGREDEGAEDSEHEDRDEASSGGGSKHDDDVICRRLAIIVYELTFLRTLRRACFVLRRAHARPNNNIAWFTAKLGKHWPLFRTSECLSMHYWMLSLVGFVLLLTKLCLTPR